MPIPPASAKIRPGGQTSTSGTPISPPDQSWPSTAAHTVPGPQIFGRFPIAADKLSETDLDPYFINFESSTRELELLLQGSIEKVNRRTLEHLSKLSADLAELGARYNGFSLSEQSTLVAAAIERVGQAVDSTYISTEELSLSLGATFAEPMRESAQFAGVVRNVLRYRVLKRVQQEMTREDLEKKRYLLDSLERSEIEAKRIDAYLANSTTLSSPLDDHCPTHQLEVNKRDSRHLLVEKDPKRPNQLIPTSHPHMVMQQARPLRLTKVNRSHRWAQPHQPLIGSLLVGTL